MRPPAITTNTPAWNERHLTAGGPAVHREAKGLLKCQHHCTAVCGVPDFDPEAALAAAAGGDQSAWESIVSAYSSMVWSVARGYRLSSADASDVFQGTWLRLVEHLGDIRDASRLGGWLATTARREALVLLRRTRRDLTTDNVAALGDTALGAPAVDEELLRTEDQRALWHAFARLSGNCQRLLRLLFADPPARYEEISMVLEMPAGSIGPTRSRCLASLERFLSAAAVE
jgi:RNA polymerase sigma factor (sigma-70 family)